MADEKGDINAITNSGTIGAIAVGRGATAIQAGGNVSVEAALAGQFSVLSTLVEQHESAAELKILLQQAIQLSKSDNPSASKPVWDKIAAYGGAIGSIVGGITGTLSLLQ